MIKAVLFDYGMVLTGPQDKAAQAKMHALLRVDAETFAGAYWRFRDDYDRGTLSGTRYWEAVVRELNREADAETLAGLMDADVQQWTQPNEPMIAWAKRLQRAGMPTGILSNLGDAMEVGVLATFPWLQDFSHHTFSHRLGIAKPDAAIYQHAVAGLGVRPEEILFLDDREENIAGAERGGIAAIQYGEHAAFVEAMHEAGFGALLDVG